MTIAIDDGVAAKASTAPSATITAALVKHAAEGNGVFCHFVQAGGVSVISHADLLREARRYAAFFRRSGVEPGQVVLIILRHSPELLYSFLGAMLAGAIPSFMPPATSKQDPRLYWSAHEKLFTRIGAGVLLTARDNLPAIRENFASLPLRLLAAEDAEDGESRGGDFSAQPDAIALLQHSSGTTGLKKGVALSHAAVLRQVASYAGALRLAADDRIVSWLPLYHDMGLIACFLLPLVTRTPVVLLDPFEWVVNPGLLFDAVKRYRGTLCWMPNFAFHHLCRAVRPSPAQDLSSMRAWIDCSEPCHPETFGLFARTFAAAGVRPEQLQVCYAMAETVFAVTQTPPGQIPRVLNIDVDACRDHGRIVVAGEGTAHRALLSTGAAIRGIEVRIRDDRGETLPDDQVGEIAVSGDCLFDGYFKLEEETRRKLRDGWYQTGDLGFLHNGELYVTGRKSDLIIVHGRNYHAHELEYLINQIPGVHPGRNVAAGWFRPEVGSEEVIVLAEFDPAAGADRATLVQAIKQRLLDEAALLVYDVQLVQPGWLVKTTSGKLSRIENLHKYLAMRAATLARAV